MPENGTGAYDYATLTRILQELTAKYPFVKVRCIGRSRLGRGIYAIIAGSAKRPALYAGGFHGCEWLTCMCLLRFARRMCEAVQSGKLLCGTDVGRAISDSGVCIIPCVNPDGVEIAVHGADSAGRLRGFVDRIMSENEAPWSANAMGVDINHNFDAGWRLLRELEIQQGITGPSPTRYGGVSPESEPETRALTAMCRRIYFRQALALHSQGEEIYWRYGDRTPEKSRIMAKVMSLCSGYTLVDNAGLASHGGFKDWFISEMRRPAFTVEIGKGKNPLPESSFSSIYRGIEEMLTVFMIM